MISRPTLASSSSSRRTPELIGGDLRAHVGQVLVRGARRIASGGEQVAQLVEARPSALDHFQRPQHHAFFCQVAGVGRHAAGTDAADLGVVRAVGGKEERRGAVRHEYRRDHRDVGQMRAAAIGVVGEHDVAGRQVGHVAQHAAHRLAHRAEVHRHVRRVRHQGPRAVEHRAREVEPLLHVDRERGAAQHGAHLFGDGGEAVVEELELDRVGSVDAWQPGSRARHLCPRASIRRAR